MTSGPGLADPFGREGDEVVPVGPDQAPLELALEPTIGTLLLIEDDDGDAFLVTELLALGSPDVEVTRVATLADAERHLISRQAPDVIVLDLGLPDAEGIQIVPRIVLAAPTTAVLVLTGLSDEDRGAAAVANGAQDYLVKGQVDERTLARAIRYAVGRKRVEDAARRQVEWELQRLQNVRLERGLLPRPWVAAGSWQVRTGYRPGQNRSLLGGDFFDVVEQQDGRLHVVIGDVAGHGPDEAALGVLLRAAWRALVLAATPGEAVLPLLARLLESERATDEVFATALHLVLDADGRHLTVHTAGHPAPISVPAAPAAVWRLNSGPPMGVMDGWVWPAQRLDVAGHFPLLLFTDGLIEGRAEQGRLGEEGLRGIVDKQRYAGPPQTLIDRLIRDAEQAHREALPDDVAVLLIEPRPDGGDRYGGDPYGGDR